MDRRRMNDELLGKVCSIENDEESSSWYLALVNTHTHSVFAQVTGGVSLYTPHVKKEPVRMRSRCRLSALSQ